jgi:2'-5' RNA ligase
VHRRPTARLFVAVDPPPYVCEQLSAWARAALRQTGPPDLGARARVLDAELLHVTLCFLGNRPTEDIDLLAAGLAQCRGPAGELSVGAPLWLPPHRPRALAVELHDEHDRLANLQRSVVAACGEPPTEHSDATAAGHARVARHRRFRPHVTVARPSSGADRRSKWSRGSEPALPPTPALSFVPSELILYRSWLSPDGANYEALASYPIA